MLMIILSHILSINWDNDANSPTTVKNEKLTEKSKHISHGCSVLVALCDFLYMSFGDSPLIKKVKQQLSDLIPKCKTLRDISISQGAWTPPCFADGDWILWLSSPQNM